MDRILFNKSIFDNNGIVIEKNVWYDVRVQDDINSDEVLFFVDMGGIEERLSRSYLMKNGISHKLEKGDMYIWS